MTGEPKAIISMRQVGPIKLPDGAKHALNSPEGVILWFTEAVWSGALVLEKVEGLDLSGTWNRLFFSGDRIEADFSFSYIGDNLKDCIASGQVSVRAVVEHHERGEYVVGSASSTTVAPPPVAAIDAKDAEIDRLRDAIKSVVKSMDERGMGRWKESRVLAAALEKPHD